MLPPLGSRRVRSTLALCGAAALLSGATGCASDGPARPKYVEPVAVPGKTATLKIDFSADKGLFARPDPIKFHSLSGSELPDTGMFGKKEVAMTPGMQRLVISYNDGYKLSMVDVEIAFVAEAGKAYHVYDWPPKLYDFNTKQPVKAGYSIVESNKLPPGVAPSAAPAQAPAKAPAQAPAAAKPATPAVKPSAKP